MSTTIKISKSLHAKLIKLKGYFMAYFERDFSFEDIIWAMLDYLEETTEGSLAEKLSILSLQGRELRKTKKCVGCGEEMFAALKECPYCGTEQSETKEKRE